MYAEMVAKSNYMGYVMMSESKLKEFRKSIRVLERELAESADDQSECCGVTIAQCHAIMEVDYNDEITVTELAARLNLDKSTLSRTVESLVQAGYLERTRGDTDRRVANLVLTESGKEMKEKIDQEMNSYYKRIFKLIPADLHESILDGFKYFAEAIQRMPLVEKKLCECISQTKKKKQGV